MLALLSCRPGLLLSLFYPFALPSLRVTTTYLRILTSTCILGKALGGHLEMLLAVREGGRWAVQTHPTVLASDSTGWLHQLPLNLGLHLTTEHGWEKQC